ncbi:MAG: deoxyribonuclease IV [Candidatus Cloacimonas sp.]|nr:deoxyribonuclease IV [Candidatus Cloacimonadota bacterium]
MNLGCHISISNGMELIFERAEEATAKSIQIFVTNQNQWSTRTPKPDEVAAFLENRQEFNPYTIVTHSRYLINLCSNDKEKEEKSVNALRDELALCVEFKIPYIVLHPGSHLGEGEEWGLVKIVQNLDLIIDEFPGLTTKILLETTAGQGTNLGYKFEHLNYILENTRYPECMGVCFDTCHTFVAGYDLKDDYDGVFEEFDRIVGLDQLKVFHLNDTKKGLGSKVDRHEHIGKGELGIGAFERLMNDPRFKETPMILETPQGKDYEMDKENLRVLRSLRK